MHFQRNFEFSERSAKMKRGTSFSDMFVCCAAVLRFQFSLWLYVLVVVLYCIVVLSSVLCSSVCFVSQWFHPSGRSLSHPRCLLTSFRLVLAWSRLALICYALFCSCRFRLPLRVAFLFRFLRVVFCKSFFFHAALLYESPRRKPGWRFTAGSPFCIFYIKIAVNCQFGFQVRVCLHLDSTFLSVSWRVGGKPST